MKYLIHTAVLAAFLLPLQAADLEETISIMAGNNAEVYLAPLATAFGTNVNSGLFSSAKPHKILGFDVTMNVAFSQIPDDDTHYQFVISSEDIQFTESFTGEDITVSLNPNELYEDNRTAATIFGPDRSYTIAVDHDEAVDDIAMQIAGELPNTTAEQVKTLYGNEINAFIQTALPPISTPKGFDIDLMPMIIPQVALGLPYDVEVMLRGAPPLKAGDLGEFSYFGYGAKIGLNQFLPLENPLYPRLSLGYYGMHLNLDDIVESHNHIISLQASKSFPFLTVYGGYGLESSEVDVEYDYYTNELTPPTKIEFSLDGSNESRVLLGARIKVFLFSVNLDYNMGEYESYNMGISIALR